MGSIDLVESFGMKFSGNKSLVPFLSRFVFSTVCVGLGDRFSSHPENLLGFVSKPDPNGLQHISGSIPV